MCARVTVATLTLVAADADGKPIPFRSPASTRRVSGSEWCRPKGGVLLLISLAVLIVGVLLLVAGLRERVVVQPRRCSACGFDLSGLGGGDGGSGGGRVCPECGADLMWDGGVLSAGEAVQLRVTSVGSVGAIVMLTAFVMMAGQFGLAATGMGERYTPQWRLEQRAIRTDRSALNEFIVRIGNGSADRERVSRLIDEGLEQRRRSVSQSRLSFKLFLHEEYPAELMWIDLLERAVLAGYASPEQVQAYVDESVVVSIYAARGGSLKVQALCMYGPRMNGLVDVQLVERVYSAAGSGPFGWPGIAAWAMQVDRPRGADEAEIWPVRIEWKVDASSLAAQLPMTVGSAGDGLWAGVSEIEWPEAGAQSGERLLERRWWMGE